MPSPNAPSLHVPWPEQMELRPPGHTPLQSARNFPSEHTPHASPVISQDTPQNPSVQKQDPSLHVPLALHTKLLFLGHTNVQSPPL